MGGINLEVLLASTILWSTGAIALSRHSSRELAVLGLVGLGAAVWLVYSVSIAAASGTGWYLPGSQAGLIPAGFIIGAYAWAFVLGAPGRLGPLLGLPIRGPDADFSRRLSQANEEFFAAIKRIGRQPGMAHAHLAAAESVVDRLAALPAPHDAWAQVRSEYVGCHRVVLAESAVVVDGTGDRLESAAELAERYATAASHAGDLMRLVLVRLGGDPQAYRRRFECTFAAVCGAAATLVVGGFALPRALPNPTDPWLWLQACLVGAIVLFAWYIALSLVSVLLGRR